MLFDGFEGRVVRIADIMAYLNHDLDDAIRSGVIQENQVPAICTQTMGRTHQERATTMINDLVFSSKTADGELALGMSDEELTAIMEQAPTGTWDPVRACSISRPAAG